MVHSCQDPYTVAPDRPEWNPAEDTDGLVAEEVSAEDTEAVAVKALGTDGERQARELEIELSTARWQSAKERLEVAKERNANQIQELRQWREERAAVPGGVPGSSFAGARSELRGALHSRMEKCAVLKILCFDEKRVDPEPLRAALSEADVAGARNYDPDLMDNGTRKLRVLDAAVAFQESIVTAEAKIDAAATASSAVQAMEEGNEGFAEAKDAASTAAEEAAAAANVLSDLLSEFKGSIKDAQACEIPVPVDLLNEERLEKAAALLEQHAAAAAAVSAETETA
ncbi:ADGB [Symbiodinium natans]|uniref:ADGB protein n=1 Tax=Symbiodinium natans TaxID=878477 RepID=A0A812TS23_9DINO|nr:ADGB [Symbiodinium natans]